MILSCVSMSENLDPNYTSFTSWPHSGGRITQEYETNTAQLSPPETALQQKLNLLIGDSQCTGHICAGFLCVHTYLVQKHKTLVLIKGGVKCICIRF